MVRGCGKRAASAHGPVEAELAVHPLAFAQDAAAEWGMEAGLESPATVVVLAAVEYAVFAVSVAHAAVPEVVGEAGPAAAAAAAAAVVVAAGSAPAALPVLEEQLLDSKSPHRAYPSIPGSAGPCLEAAVSA